MRGNAHYRFIYNVIFQDIAAAHREPKVHSSQQRNLYAWWGNRCFCPPLLVGSRTPDYIEGGLIPPKGFLSGQKFANLSGLYLALLSILPQKAPINTQKRKKISRRAPDRSKRLKFLSFVRTGIWVPRHFGPILSGFAPGCFENFLKICPDWYQGVPSIIRGPIGVQECFNLLQVVQNKSAVKEVL